MEIKKINLNAAYPYAETTKGTVFFTRNEILSASGDVGIEIPDELDAPHWFLANHERVADVVYKMIERQEYWVDRNQMFNGTAVYGQEKFNELRWLEKVWYFNCHRKSLRQKTWFINMCAYVNGSRNELDMSITTDVAHFANKMREVREVETSKVELAKAA